MKEKLKNLCEIKQAKNQAKECKGEYFLYLSPQIKKHTDVFEFEGLSLLVRTLGENLDEVVFVDERFSAGRGVWVLQNFKINPYYLKKQLVKELKKYKHSTSRYDACINLHKKDIENICVEIASDETMNRVGEFYEKIDRKKKIEERIKELYELEKTYFLKNMFM